MRKLAKLGAPVALLCLAFLITAASAQAASPLKVREVFPGSSTTDPKAEYVELQMTAAGQNDVDGQILQFWDATGHLISTYTIPTDVANGQSQRTVLLATQEAVELFPGLPAPDFNIGSGANRMDPSGGGVCIIGTSPSDCVTWGSSFPHPGLGDPPILADDQNANAVAITDELALRRSIAPSCPTYLEASDDTANSSTDFTQAVPGPRNNTAVPTEVHCPPDTGLLTSPANPTNQTSASFTYSAITDEPGVSFECRLDAASFASCPNAGKSYPGPLGDGSHTFRVRAVGEGGPDPTPVATTWTVDTIPPDTIIDSTPPQPSDGFPASTTFKFHSTEANSTFRCQLDDGEIQVCSSTGKSYFISAEGSHTFRVWAVDNAVNKDPTPAEHTFLVIPVDQTPPDTTITSAPANPSPSDSAGFAYSSNEQGSSFQCSLNGSPFASCPASGVAYSRLRNGSYRFEVRATDQAGNVDSVPASYSWTVAAPLPKVTFTKAPPGKVNLKSGSKVSLLFKFKADKPGSTFRCRIDKKAFAPCSPTTKVKAKVGRHRFEVYAIDELGNVGTSTARRLFRVEKKKAGGLF